MTAIAGLNIHLVSSVLHYGSGIGHGRSVINPFRLLANISDAILTLFFAVISIQINLTRNAFPRGVQCSSDFWWSLFLGCNAFRYAFVDLILRISKRFANEYAVIDFQNHKMPRLLLGSPVGSIYWVR